MVLSCTTAAYVSPKQFTTVLFSGPAKQRFVCLIKICVTFAVGWQLACTPSSISHAQHGINAAQRVLYSTDCMALLLYTTAVMLCVSLQHDLRSLVLNSISVSWCLSLSHREPGAQGVHRGRRASRTCCTTRETSRPYRRLHTKVRDICERKNNSLKSYTPHL